MNTTLLDKNVAVFSRVANYVVTRHINATASSVSYEYMQEMINKMNTINHILMASAIRMVNKAKERHNVDIDALTTSLKNIIHNSVEHYAKSVQ